MASSRVTAALLVTTLLLGRTASLVTTSLRVKIALWAATLLLGRIASLATMSLLAGLAGNTLKVMTLLARKILWVDTSGSSGHDMDADDHGSCCVIGLLGS